MALLVLGEVNIAWDALSIGLGFFEGKEILMYENAEHVTCFILNRIRIHELTLPLQIFDGCLIRKAQENEVKKFKEAIYKYSLIGSSHLMYPYEHEIIEEKWVELAEELWFYYVFEFHKTSLYSIQDQIAGFRKILNLTSLELEIDVELPYVLGSELRKILPSDDLEDEKLYQKQMTYFPSRLNMFFNLKKTREEKIITVEFIEEMKTVYKNYWNTLNYDILQKSIDRTYELGELSHKSPLYAIALFSIIEFILISRDSEKSSPNSIGWQISRKVILFNRRFDDPIDFWKYIDFSENLSEVKIIEKLYKLRSCVAHGSDLDFDKELKILKNYTNSIKLLNIITRSLIKQFLIEPMLFSDIREL